MAASPTARLPVTSSRALAWRVRRTRRPAPTVTTALGLMVALPAVWLHNYLTQKVEQFQVEMNHSSSELLDRLVELAPERS